MIISTDARKTFDKSQCPFMIKKKKTTSQQNRCWRNIPQCNKGHTIFNGNKLKAISLKIRNRLRMHTHYLCSTKYLKFSKPGFSNMWTMDFQTFKLVLEKAEEPELKLPAMLNHWKSKRVPEKHLLFLYWPCQSLWLCGSQ